GAPHHIHRTADVGQGLAGFLEKQPAGVGQRHVPVAALEQAHPEFLFQGLDLLAQRRLGNAQHLSGAAEMQLLGDGDEIAQVAQFHKGSMSRKTYRSCRILYWIEISILLILVTIPTTKTVLAPADPCVTAAFCPKKIRSRGPPCADPIPTQPMPASLPTRSLPLAA